MANDLLNRLSEEINKIPAIDIHSHIRASEPTAENAAGAFFYNHINTELITAGMPADDTSDLSPAERVKKTLPYIPRIKNTTTYWCLQQILTDLFGIESLDESTAEKAPVLSAKETLEKANVEKVVIMSDWSRKMPKVTDLPFTPALRLDTLLNDPYTSRTMDQIGDIYGESIYEASDLRKAIQKIIADAAEAGCKSFAASFNPKVTFERGSRDAADRILSLVLLGQKTNQDDRKALRSFVMTTVLDAAAEHGLTFQLMLGVIRKMPGEKSLSAFEPDLLRSFAEMFNEYDSVNFDVILANAVQSNELAVMAKYYPNITTSGFWWHVFYSSHISRMIRERIDMLPMTKSCALASDAYNVQWVYARTKLVRKILAKTLAELIEDGFLTEESAVEVARYYLRDNAVKLYL